MWNPKKSGTDRIELEKTGVESVEMKEDQR